jgi:hypothetical protein
MDYSKYVDERDTARNAIQYALDHGWKPRKWDNADLNETIVAFDIWKYGMRKVMFFNEDATQFQIPIYEILFNHDFAKCLWGTKTVLSRDNNYTMIETWQYHLQKMAIAENPLDYINTFSKPIALMSSIDHTL